MQCFSNIFHPKFKMIMKNFLFLFCILGTSCFRYGSSEELLKKVSQETNDIKNFPYEVQIYDQKGYNIRCEGAIISDLWIITTARCISSLGKEDMKIVSGGNSDGLEFSYEEQYIVYDNSFGSESHDIGLLKLKTPLKFTDKQKPLRIRSTPLSENELLNINGWKEDENEYSLEHLGPATYSQVDSKTCHENFKSWDRAVTQDEFCVQTEKSQKCRSSDPGAVATDVHGNIVGLLSFGRECINGNYDGILTNVVKYRQWIWNNTNVQTLNENDFFSIKV